MFTHSPLGKQYSPSRHSLMSVKRQDKPALQYDTEKKQRCAALSKHVTVIVALITVVGTDLYTGVQGQRFCSLADSHSGRSRPCSRTASLHHRCQGSGSHPHLRKGEGGGCSLVLARTHTHTSASCIGLSVPPKRG